MDYEELKDLVRKAIEEIKSETTETTDIAENACKNEEPASESPEAKTEETEARPTAEEPVVNEDTPAEKAEDKIEDKIEDKVEEVVKIEALNSSPAPILTAEPEWKKLTGKAFRDWCDRFARNPMAS